MINTPVWIFGSAQNILSSGTPTAIWMFGSVRVLNENTTLAALELSGNIQAQAASATGSFGVVDSISGSVQAPAATVAGEISVADFDMINISGSVQAAAATASGNVGVIGSISGAVQAQAARVAGSISAEEEDVEYISGNVQAQAARCSGEIDISISMSGNVQASIATASGIIFYNGRTTILQTLIITPTTLSLVYTPEMKFKAAVSSMNEHVDGSILSSQILIAEDKGDHMEMEIIKGAAVTITGYNSMTKFFEKTITITDEDTANLVDYL
jgi:hypothetical protein